MNTHQVERWAENWHGLEPRYIEDMAHAVSCSNCNKEFDDRSCDAVLLENAELYFCDYDCKHEYDEENA